MCAHIWMHALERVVVYAWALCTGGVLQLPTDEPLVAVASGPLRGLSSVRLPADWAFQTSAQFLGLKGMCSRGCSQSYTMKSEKVSILPRLGRCSNATLVSLSPCAAQVWVGDSCPHLQSPGAGSHLLLIHGRQRERGVYTQWRDSPLMICPLPWCTALQLEAVHIHSISTDRPMAIMLLKMLQCVTRGDSNASQPGSSLAPWYWCFSKLMSFYVLAISTSSWDQRLVFELFPS